MRWGFLSKLVMYYFSLSAALMGNTVSRWNITQSSNDLQDIPLGPSREAPCTLTNVLPTICSEQALALRRKQVWVEHKHLACSSGHCTRGILNSFLGLLKIILEASLHSVFGHFCCFFGLLCFLLGFWGLRQGFFSGFLGLCQGFLLAIVFCPELIPLSRVRPASANSTAFLAST